MKNKVSYSIIALATLPLLWGTVAFLPFTSSIQTAFFSFTENFFYLAGMSRNPGLEVITYYLVLYILYSIFFVSLILYLIGWKLKQWILAVLLLLPTLLPLLAIYINSQVTTITYDENKQAITEAYEYTFFDLYEIVPVEDISSADNESTNNIRIRFFIRRLPEISSSYTIEFALRNNESLEYLNSGNLIEMNKVNGEWQYRFQQGQFPDAEYYSYKYESKPVTDTDVEAPRGILSFYLPTSQLATQKGTELMVSMTDNDPESPFYNRIVYEREVPVNIRTTLPSRQ